MPLKRYLLHFGYIGTYFRGVQKQACKGVDVNPAETVQGLLEICLSKLRIKPVNKPIVVPSSRTDSGVHALCSTAHTDLDFNDYNITTEQITAGLNFVVRKAGFTNLCIYSVREVPNNFSARFNAVSRTYIFRFAVLKKKFDVSRYSKLTSIPLPVLEVDRCHFILDSNIDLVLAAKGCSKFVGTKDFRSFMGSYKEPEDLVTRRTIYSFELQPSRAFYPCPLTDNFDFYQFTVTGQSFLYRQVRRMVGCMFAVGLKNVSLPDIDYLLSYPSKESWNDMVSVPPGCALYLASVKYDEADMVLTDDNRIVTPYNSTQQ